MSSKIQAQATKFWQAVVSAETVNAYTKALDVTWTILKEAAILLWLVVCLVLVAFDWSYDTATSAGRNTRNWWDGISQKGDSSEIATETGKQLVEASKASLFSTISQARSQLGLPDKPKAAEAPIEKATANNGSSKPSPVTSSTTPSSTTPASTPASAVSSSASSTSASE